MRHEMQHQMLSIVRSLMNSLKISAEDAVRRMGLSDSDQDLYLKLLKQSSWTAKGVSDAKTFTPVLTGRPMFAVCHFSSSRFSEKTGNNIRFTGAYGSAPNHSILSPLRWAPLKTAKNQRRFLFLSFSRTAHDAWRYSGLSLNFAFSFRLRKADFHKECRDFRHHSETSGYRAWCTRIPHQKPRNSQVRNIRRSVQKNVPRGYPWYRGSAPRYQGNRKAGRQ